MVEPFSATLPLYDPIKGQLAVIKCNETIYKKSLLLELLIKAAYKGEASVKDSIVKALKGTELPNYDEWSTVNANELDINKLERITLFQSSFLETEKEDYSSLDFIIFALLTLHSNEFMECSITVTHISDLLEVEPETVLESLEFLFENFWCEKSHHGYTLHVPYHAKVKCSWSIRGE